MTRETHYAIPVTDEGDGGVYMDVRVSEELSPDAVLYVFDALAKAGHRLKWPIRLSLVTAPPPFFVTVREAARLLCVTQSYVELLVDAGYLPVVRHQRDDAGMADRVAPDVLSALPPDATVKGHDRLIPFAAVAEKAAQALETGRLPLPTGRREQERASRARHRPNQRARQGLNVSKLARDVLRESGEPLILGEIVEDVVERMGEEEVEKRGDQSIYNTVQVAVLHAVKRGLVRREVDVDNEFGPTYYRWQDTPKVEAAVDWAKGPARPEDAGQWAQVCDDIALLRHKYAHAEGYEQRKIGTQLRKAERRAAELTQPALIVNDEVVA